MSFDVKELLYTAAYRPADMERLLDPQRETFVKFDPQLGYVLKDYVFRDGMDDTLSTYTYEPHGGHRKMINHADKPCRINTFGDSFTQCAQVSDGETWQEILAAHIGEPIRNFGVGGYGVYQAWLSALRVEAVEDLSAEYVILNIWDDDHLRNLDAARWIRVGWMHRELVQSSREEEDPYPIHGFPWAHVRYDLDKGHFVELPGGCKDEDDLRKLGDPDNFYEMFKDDTVVHLYTLAEGGEAPVEQLEALAEAFEMQVDLRDPNRRAGDAHKLHLTYGLRSTMYLIDKMRAWADENGKKLMILQSYGPPAVKTFIETRQRFDQELVDYLADNDVPNVDLLAKADEEYKAFNLSVDKFLERFYIGRAGAQVFGHYNPYGNFWFAFSIRQELVNWLNPRPPAYR